MSLISLRKYLNADGKRKPHDEVSKHACNLICSDLHALILQHAYPAGALGSAPGSDFLELARTSPEQRDELLRGLAANLQARSTQDQKQSRRHAQEMQNLFAILNSALTSLAHGSESSVAHLKQVESQLSRASLIEDMTTLKSTLNSTVVLLRQEAERRQRESGEELRSFEQAYREARQSVSAALDIAPGRDAACEALRQSQELSQPPLLIVACVFERLRMLAGRFGQSAAEDLVRCFLSTVVNHATPLPAVFEWSRDMLVWMARPGLPSVEARAYWEARLNQPFEFRTLAGGRSVLLSVNCRWMCAFVPPDQPECLIEEIDYFNKGGRPKW